MKAVSEVHRVAVNRAQEEARREARGKEQYGANVKRTQTLDDGWLDWRKCWRNCPTYVIAGLEELYNQLLPTKLYAPMLR